MSAVASLAEKQKAIFNHRGAGYGGYGVPRTSHSCDDGVKWIGVTAEKKRKDEEAYRKLP